MTSGVKDKVWENHLQIILVLILVKNAELPKEKVTVSQKATTTTVLSKEKLRYTGHFGMVLKKLQVQHFI